MRGTNEPSISDLAGLLWTWWKGDSLPILPPLPALTAVESGDVGLLASLIDTSREDILSHIRRGHHPYIARVGTDPVAYGWSASGKATFGGGLVTFQIPAGNRYLYDFVTLPAWRGRGIYPHLLQAILRRESAEIERFWIIHQSLNVASERGIAKAGFQLACRVYFLQATNTLALAPAQKDGERATAGAKMLGLPFIDERRS